ncbi:MAG: metallophosphoesterase [Magnetococcales bacterium]|nr:metallophosphoesterase [Magnetococcales bacterium]MBF0114338.1 metallophosphoesterase [Magnetococcales bacterium]
MVELQQKQEAGGESARVHTVILSDTDNDLHAIQYVLWLTGLCHRDGRWRKGVHGFRVIHTGDWLNKFNPNPEVLDYLRHLQESAPVDCAVHLLVGNHEVEILQRSAQGWRSRLSEEQLAFIRQQDVLHVADQILYLHGYPTLNLLMLLWQLQQETGDVGLFNDRFRKAFYEGRYALFREKEGLEIVGDIRHVKQYYLRVGSDGELYGQQVSRLLQQLGIQTVIHGHRPNILIQLDYEFQEEIPQVRIINNDNKASLTGFGAAIVDRWGNVRFINPKAMFVLGGEKAFRKKIGRVLGTGTGRKGTGSKRQQQRALQKEQEAVLGTVSQIEC